MLLDLTLGSLAYSLTPIHEGQEVILLCSSSMLFQESAEYWSSEVLIKYRIIKHFLALPYVRINVKTPSSIFFWSEKKENIFLATHTQYWFHLDVHKWVYLPFVKAQKNTRQQFCFNLIQHCHLNFISFSFFY